MNKNEIKRQMNKIKWNKINVNEKWGILKYLSVEISSETTKLLSFKRRVEGENKSETLKNKQIKCWLKIVILNG